MRMPKGPGRRPVPLRYNAQDLKLAEARQATARKDLAKGRASVARARAAITRGRETLVRRAKAGELDAVLAPIHANFDAADAALNAVIEKAAAQQIAAIPNDRCLSDEQRVIKNALIESFALHFRNLAEFLWPERTTKKGNKRAPQKSDPVVGYFTAGWLPPEPAGLNDLIERVNREIGHLTTYRRAGEHPKKRWDIPECIRALRALAEFVRRSEMAGTLPAGVPPAVSGLLNLVENETSVHSFGERVNATTRLW
jgi:hypothetical protein